MKIETQLFEYPHLRLTAVNVDKDAATIADWTYDLWIANSLRGSSGAPLNVVETKRWLEKELKEGDEIRNSFLFAIHSRQEEQIVGLLRIWHIQWSHAVGTLQIILPEANRKPHFFLEAIQSVLDFSFGELNLYRLNIHTLPECNTDEISDYEQAGFKLEVRQRQSIFYQGRLLDGLFYGMLRSEWDELQRINTHG